LRNRLNFVLLLCRDPGLNQAKTDRHIAAAQGQGTREVPPPSSPKFWMGTSTQFAGVRLAKSAGSAIKYGRANIGHSRKIAGER